MATSAMAQRTLFALRQKIAKIEGTLPERLTPSGASETVLRRKGIAARQDAARIFSTGAGRLDDALGGGLPYAALTEIHGGEVRDAGAVAGFALALAGLVLKSRKAGGGQNRFPILWKIGRASCRERV